MLKKYKSGQIIVFFPILFVVIVSLTGIAFDFGNALVYKNKMQAVVDAATLAGAKSIHFGASEATSSITDFIQRNGYTVNDITVETPYQGDSQKVRVSLTDDVPYFFFKIMGKTSQTIVQSTIAQGGEVNYRGCNGLIAPDIAYNRGTDYDIKSGTGGHGNYGAVGLGGNGANQFRDNLKYGYQGAPVSIGDTVTTEPGKMKGPSSTGYYYRFNDGYPGETWDNYTAGNPRVVMVAMVSPSPFDSNGRSDVTVTNFGLFFLNGYNSSDGEITATYIGHPDDYPFGDGQDSFSEASLIE
ncbi:pilus assembly protein TadG-related protein [Candidatus Margulisiibacteriota bacterium]